MPMTETTEKPDALVPDPQVWEELGVTSMTGWRYTHDRELNFPPPIKISQSKLPESENAGRVQEALGAERAR